MKKIEKLPVVCVALYILALVLDGLTFIGLFKVVLILLGLVIVGVATIQYEHFGRSFRKIIYSVFYAVGLFLIAFNYNIFRATSTIGTDLRFFEPSYYTNSLGLTLALFQLFSIAFTIQTCLLQFSNVATNISRKRLSVLMGIIGSAFYFYQPIYLYNTWGALGGYNFGKYLPAAFVCLFYVLIDIIVYPYIERLTD